MHAPGERAILRCHLRDAVQDRLQAVGLPGALRAPGAQLGGACLHRGTLLGAEAAGLGPGIVRGHSRASFPGRSAARCQAGLPPKGQARPHRGASRFLTGSGPAEALWVAAPCTDRTSGPAAFGYLLGMGVTVWTARCADAMRASSRLVCAPRQYTWPQVRQRENAW